MEMSKKTIDLKTSEGRNLFYQTPEWYAIRRIVLTASPYCVECIKEKIYKVATEVDHIIDIKTAPERCFDYTNLQSLCKSCHSRKTFNENRETTGFGKKNTFKQINKKWPTLGIN